ncbi:hypothetical protein ASL20_11275 [Cupriavidus necator]|nr:hypothetical protein ASL20_11275 [Cupriavidus necator]
MKYFATCEEARMLVEVVKLSGFQAVDGKPTRPGMNPSIIRPPGVGEGNSLSKTLSADVSEGVAIGLVSLARIVSSFDWTLMFPSLHSQLPPRPMT